MVEIDFKLSQEAPLLYSKGHLWLCKGYVLELCILLCSKLWIRREKGSSEVRVNDSTMVYGQHLTQQGCPRDGGEMHEGPRRWDDHWSLIGQQWEWENRGGTESLVDSQTGDLRIRDTRGISEESMWKGEAGGDMKLGVGDSDGWWWWWQQQQWQQQQQLAQLGGKKGNKKLAILQVRIKRLMYIMSLGTCDCDSTTSTQILWGNGAMG